MTIGSCEEIFRLALVSLTKFPCHEVCTRKQVRQNLEPERKF